MTDMNITQSEADILLQMEKFCYDDKMFRFPHMGDKLVIPLFSENRREEFTLDIEQATIKLSKVKYQNRTRSIIILARLDLSGGPHQNPDGEIVPCPHIHLFKEGYNDKWAYKINFDDFPNIVDSRASLTDFLQFCNIIDIQIQLGVIQ